jgi:hypothetical protein
MAITVNTTDTFEQWRVKTNQISANVDGVNSDLSSNVSTINTNIVGNVAIINDNIVGNVAIIHDNIVANVTAVNSDLSSNVITINTNIVANVESILANVSNSTGNVSTGNLSVSSNALISSNVTVLGNILLQGQMIGNAATVTNGVYTTDFTGSNNSLGANGYQKLPGGLIIQWGTVTVSPAFNGTQAVAFPTAFASSVYSVSATPISVSLQGGDKRDSFSVQSVSTSGFTMNSAFEDIASLSYYWMAVGV